MDRNLLDISYTKSQTKVKLYWKQKADEKHLFGWAIEKHDNGLKVTFKGTIIVTNLWEI